MKVLLVQVDVSNLSDDEIEELEYAFAAQLEDFDAELINMGTKEVKDEDDRDPIH